MAENKKPSKPASAKSPPEEKGENVRERIVIWLVVAATVAVIWLLLAYSKREKQLVCDGSHGGSITAFGSCK